MTMPIRPDDVLPDSSDSASFGGITGRKGTIAAFIANAKLLEGLAVNSAEYEVVLAQLRELAPVLRAVGMLDVFAPRSPVIAALFAEPD